MGTSEGAAIAFFAALILDLLEERIRIAIAIRFLMRQPTDALHLVFFEFCHEQLGRKLDFGNVEEFLARLLFEHIVQVGVLLILGYDLGLCRVQGLGSRDGSFASR